MRLWLVSLLPVAAGLVLWMAGRGRSRSGLGTAAGLTLAVTGGLAGWGAAAGGTASYRWGAGLDLHLSVDDPAAVALVLVPAVALPVVVYAAAHEPVRGLARLVGALVGFVGAMELLVLAGDLLTLLVAWELVGAFSWALIAHEWWHADKPTAAAHAFVTTRAGDLGLFAAAGAALAGVGSLRYDALGGLSGGWLHLLVAGIVLAAAAKSAQVPFSPWLFSAMAGPTPVSALLHAATMVAAGAYLLVRLQPVLDRAAWFAPAVIAIGLATALAGGLVAAVQQHLKKLAAASTSAHYGLMFVAIGAGVPAAALAHLVTHAALKAPLFLSAGVAMAAAGTSQLAGMRLGRALPRLAVWTGLSVLALAAVPPLGAAWTKEAIGAAAGHWAAWLAVAVAVAGLFSALYATRFQLLAYGPPRLRRPADEAGSGGGPDDRPNLAVEATIAVGGVASVALGVLWLPGAEGVVESIAGGTLVPGKTWEAALSFALVALGVVLAAGGNAVLRVLRQRVVPVARVASAAIGATRDVVDDWMALPRVAKAAVVDPVLGAAAAADRFDVAVLDAPARAAATLGRRLSARVAREDARVVDAGVRAVAALARWAARVGATVTERGVDFGVGGLARLTGAGGRALRRLHTGLAHHYYVAIVAGAAVVLVVATVGR